MAKTFKHKILPRTAENTDPNNIQKCFYQIICGDWLDNRDIMRYSEDEILALWFVETKVWQRKVAFKIHNLGSLYTEEKAISIIDKFMPKVTENEIFSCWATSTWEIVDFLQEKWIIE